MTTFLFRATAIEYRPAWLCKRTDESKVRESSRDDITFDILSAARTRPALNNSTWLNTGMISST